MDVIGNLFSYLAPGSFFFIDLFAATTNALSGALLAQRPDHYRGNYFTAVGILVLAVFGGLGGGVTRDVVLSTTPEALINPWYLLMCFAAGLVGLFVAFDRGQKFREMSYVFMTSFSLPWYAVVGVEKGLQAGWPLLGAIFLGVVGPTAGRFLIDTACGVTAKQFIQGEWFVGTAVVTSVVYFILRAPVALGLEFLPSTFIAVGIGFVFRMAAMWFGWEEPMPRVPASLLKGQPERESLKDEMQPGRTSPAD